MTPIPKKFIYVGSVPFIMALLAFGIPSMCAVSAYNSRDLRAEGQQTEALVLEKNTATVRRGNKLRTVYSADVVFPLPEGGEAIVTLDDLGSFTHTDMKENEPVEIYYLVREGTVQAKLKSEIETSCVEVGLFSVILGSIVSAPFLLILFWMYRRDRKAATT
ncbi:MAG: hypothetical protein AAGD25_29730 [Cyanobacteria bacterium P01_F01_bin.150]